MTVVSKRYVYLIFIILVIISALYIAGWYFHLSSLSSLFVFGQKSVVLLEPEIESYKKKPKYPGGIEMPNSDSLIYSKLQDLSKQVSINQVNVLPGPEETIEKNLQYALLGNTRRSGDILGCGTEEMVSGESITEILSSTESSSEYIASELYDAPMRGGGDGQSRAKSEGLESNNVNNRVVSWSKGTADDSTLVSSIDDVLENIGYYEESLKSPDLAVEASMGNDKDDDEMGPPKTKEVLGQISSGYGKVKVTKSDNGVHHTNTESNSDRSREGYLIQLAITRSQSHASTIWDQIKSKNDKILANNNLILKKRSSKENKIFYLVLTGPYSSESKAKLVCGALKRNRQNCIIIGCDAN